MRNRLFYHVYDNRTYTCTCRSILRELASLFIKTAIINFAKKTLQVDNCFWWRESLAQNSNHTLFCLPRRPTNSENVQFTIVANTVSCSPKSACIFPDQTSYHSFEIGINVGVRGAVPKQFKMQLII